MDPPPSPYTDNKSAIADFGIDPGPRINSGVVIVDTAYIHTPYALERRGLCVLINGHLVYGGCEWPPFDKRVPNDPGDPPKGESPVESGPGDSRMGYWSRKYRYLASHFDAAITRDLMTEALRKSGFYKEVRADTTHDGPTDVFVTDLEGHGYGMEFGNRCSPWSAMASMCGRG